MEFVETTFETVTPHNFFYIGEVLCEKLDDTHARKVSVHAHTTFEVEKEHHVEVIRLVN